MVDTTVIIQPANTTVVQVNEPVVNQITVTDSSVVNQITINENIRLVDISADRIFNNGHVFSVQTDGSILMPNGSRIVYDQGAGGDVDIISSNGGWVELQSSAGNSYMWVDESGAYIATNWWYGGKNWFFDRNGSIVFPDGTYQNTAFTGSADLSPAFNAANTAQYTANLSFDKANAAYNLANNVAPQVTPAFNQANSAYAQANAAYNKANNAVTDFSPAFNAANTAQYTANLAYDKANSAYTLANNVAPQVTPAFNAANNAQYTANLAYDKANTRFSSNGGVIYGDVTISGNLSLTGNTVFNNVSTFVVNDPLIYLAGNNYVSDIVNIGFVANYNNGACSTIHTGLFRSPITKEYYVFQGYDKEPDGNYIDVNGNNFTISVLNASLRTSNIILNGVNAYSLITASYNQANAAPGIANSYAVTVGAAANGWTNTVWGYVNTSITGIQYTANLAFNQANTAYSTANTNYNTLLPLINMSLVGL